MALRQRHTRLLQILGDACISSSFSLSLTKTDDQSDRRQASESHLLPRALRQRGDQQNREDEDEEPGGEVGDRGVKHGVDEVAESRADLIESVHQFAPFKSRQHVMPRIVGLAKNALRLTFTSGGYT